MGVRTATIQETISTLFEEEVVVVYCTVLWTKYSTHVRNQETISTRFEDD